MQITIELTDPKATKIIESIPESERNRIIESYILLGDTVLRYAQITTSEASLQRFFDPAVKMLDGAVTSLVQLHTTFQGTWSTQSTALERLIPALATAPTRGAITNEVVFQTLSSGFRDDIFADVSGKASFTDITATPAGAQQAILIELKDYTNDVPSVEVAKFWRDMELRKARIGMFVSMHTRIQTITSDFVIQAQGAQVAIFVVNAELGSKGYMMVYALARRLLLMLEEQTKVPDTDKMGFMAKVLNNQLRTIKTELDTLANIKSDLEKTRKDIDTRLGQITEKLGKVNERVLNVVSDTIRDFIDELPEQTG